MGPPPAGDLQPARTAGWATGLRDWTAPTWRMRARWTISERELVGVLNLTTGPLDDLGEGMGGCPQSDHSI